LLDTTDSGSSLLYGLAGFTRHACAAQFGEANRRENIGPDPECTFRRPSQRFRHSLLGSSFSAVFDLFATHCSA
jgi:hypothetical protein